MPQDQQGQPVVVFRSGNYMEAELAASALRGHNIEACVLDDNICRVYPWAAPMGGGAQVLVRSDDLESAFDVLRMGSRHELPPFEGAFLTIPLSEFAILTTMISRLGDRNKWSRYWAGEESAAPPDSLPPNDVGPHGGEDSPRLL